MRRFVVFVSLIALPALAQTVDQRIDAEMPALVKMYQSLHAAPELSMQEAKTSAFVAARLRELGYDVTERVGKYPNASIPCYGVVAVMKNGAGPVVMLRSDMDALPVSEQTGLPFASTVKAKPISEDATGEETPVMHACGHDLHMTTLLATAKLLAGMKSQWHGTAILIGQPAEEVVQGADAMLRDGLYERFPKPAYVVAVHDSAIIESGKVGYTPGFALAASDSVAITVRGVSGHGASPQSTKDPIVLASEIVLALQTIASRENNPLDPIIVTVGSIHGGTKGNIIPDEVKLALTVRTYKPEVRKRVLAAIERIARGTAMAAGVPDDRMPIVTLTPGTSATYNDPTLTRRLATAVAKMAGEKNVMEVDPLMVSEDFSRYSLDRTLPTALFHVGAADPAKVASGAPLPSLHSSKFAPAPVEMVLRRAIETEVAMMLELLR